VPSMKNFSYHHELQKIIDNKQLSEVRFYSNPGKFSVGYILSANDEFLTLAEIDPKVHLDGVSVYRTEDVCSVKVETTYLGKFGKKIKNDSLYQQAIKSTEKMKKFDFEGFISTFIHTDTIAEIHTDNTESLAGKIVGYDGEVLAIDEFDDKGRHSARTYIKLALVMRLSVDVGWTRKISRSLANKKI
jgi:hypothetical protein